MSNGYLLKGQNAPVAVDATAAVEGTIIHHGGDLMFYASGTFTTAVLMYSPAQGLPYVALHTLNAAGAAKVYAGKGFLRAVLTGTVTGANVFVG